MGGGGGDGEESVSSLEDIVASLELTTSPGDGLGFFRPFGMLEIVFVAYVVFDAP